MQDSDTYLLSSQLEIKYDVNSTIERSFQMDPQVENIAVLTDTEADIPAEILAGQARCFPAQKSRSPASEMETRLRFLMFAVCTAGRAG